MPSRTTVDLEMLSASWDFIVIKLKIAEGPDGRAVERCDAIARLHTGGLNGISRLLHHQTLGNVQLDSNRPDVGPAIHIGQLVQNACLLTMNQLEIADQMTLDTLIAGERALDERWNLTREERRRPIGFLQFAVLDTCRWSSSPCSSATSRLFRSRYVIGPLRIASSISHVNLLVRVHQKIVEVLFQSRSNKRDIHIIHAGDANTNILTEQLAAC